MAAQESRTKEVNSMLSRDLWANVFTWMIIVTVGVYFYLTYSVHGSDFVKFGIIILILILQSISHFIPKLKDWEFLNSGGSGALIIYNVAVALLFFWFIPLYSPFVIIIPAVMFITIYYRGVVGYLIALGSLVGIVVLVTVRNGVAIPPHTHYFPILTIVLGAAFGGIMQRVSAIDKEVRSALDKASSRVELDRQQLNSLINNMSDSVLAIDQAGKIMFYNKAFLELFNLPTAIEGKDFTEFIKIYDNQKQVVNLLALAKVAGRDVQPKGLYFLPNSEERIELYIDISPIRTSYNQKQQAGFIVILRDITKEKSLEEERDEFIAVTSHELRTPIAAAEGNISFILHSDMATSLLPLVKYHLNQAHDNILFLADLTNDLDMLAKAEQKRLKPNITPTQPAQVVEDVFQSFANQAKQKGLILKKQLAINLPAINTSPEYLKEILQSFVSNAIKYTPRGSIIIGVKPSEDGGILFSVTDTGIGIGKSDKNKIFKKFYRSEDYRTRQTRGTGLGLYTSLKLADLIHARIWFSSELNQGSTFFLQIPISSDKSI